MMESTSEIRNSKLEMAASTGDRCTLLKTTVSAFFVLAILSNIGCFRGDNITFNVKMPPTITTKGGVEMVLIPAGSFGMGFRMGTQ